HDALPISVEASTPPTKHTVMRLGGGEGNRTPVQNASRLPELQPCLDYGGGWGDLQGPPPAIFSGLAFGAEQALAIAGDQVDFQIHLAARLEAAERGVFQGVGDQVDGEVGALDLVGGQAGAVDDDRPFARDELGDVFRGADFEQAVVADRVEAQHFADPVDVAGDQ